MLDPEITQRVIADRRATARPAVRRQCAPHRRNKPARRLPTPSIVAYSRSRNSSFGSNRASRPRMPFARLDARVERGRDRNRCHRDFPDSRPRGLTGVSRQGRPGVPLDCVPFWVSLPRGGSRLARVSAVQADPDQKTAATESCREDRPRAGRRDRFPSRRPFSSPSSPHFERTFTGPPALSTSSL